MRVQVQHQRFVLVGREGGPRLMAVVVLPTPPFWFATAIIRGSDIMHHHGLSDTYPPSLRPPGGRRQARMLVRVEGVSRETWLQPTEPAALEAG